MGEVYHCDGSLAHQVGGVHVVVEQSVEEDTACQHEQDGGIGGDGMPLVADDGRTFTIEMETGTGKTYTYIKTMYELNARYGWSKFVIVVPSIAIREGVFKSFESMAEHFAGEYGKRMQYFIYNSKQLAKIDAFASDNGIHAMIINTQAFNASSCR